MEERIYKIIEDCDNLQADDTMTVTEFGRNKDLTLYIHKDCDYKPEVDEDYNNMVFISTKQNDTFVDDTGNVHVLDLYRELERVWNYKDFKTL